MPRNRMSLAGAITAAKAAYAAGFRDEKLLIAIAVAGAESKFDPNAVGDVEIGITSPKWDSSIGLWQIRSLELDDLYLEPIRDPRKLKDPYYNAVAAFQISKAGTDWSPWSTFGNNAYQAYMELAREASAAYAELKKNSSSVLLLIVLIVMLYLIFK